MKMKQLFKSVVVGASAAMMFSASFAADMTGAGEKFHYPIYEKLA